MVYEYDYGDDDYWPDPRDFDDDDKPSGSRRKNF